MKRLGILLLIAAATAILFSFGSAAWLVGTTEGGRWFLSFVSRYVAPEVSAGYIEGRLAGHLVLTGVRIGMPSQKLEIDRLELRWKPVLLLSGTIGIQTLSLQGVRLADSAPASKKPFELNWPSASRAAELFDVKIARLQIIDLSYRRLDEKPLSVNSISGSATWQGTLLSVNDLGFASSLGQISGNIEAGFNRPSFKAELGISLTQPLAEMTAFSLKTSLLPGKKTEQLAGSVAIAGASGAKQRLKLSCDLGVARNSLNLRKLDLTEEGRHGRATGDATLAFSGIEPLLTAALRVSGLDLAKETGMSTDLSGTMLFFGTLDSYKGQFDIANKGKGWKAMQFSGKYQGNSDGVKLTSLAGRLLEGSVQGNLDVGWEKGIKVAGAVSGRKLNPSVLAQEWKGAANFNLKGNMAWPQHAPPKGEVYGILLESRLHGHALRGNVRASFNDNNMLINSLRIQGKGFVIHAAGELDKKITFAVQSDDLSRLIPETTGELHADGWLHKRKAGLSGALAASAKRLSANGIRVDAAQLSARLGAGKDYPLHVAATLGKVSYGGFQAGRATLAVDGTTLEHTLEAALSSNGANARLTLSGKYDQGNWRGWVTRFSGSDNVSPFNLAAPARLDISAKRVYLAPLTVDGAQKERAAVSAEFGREPLGSRVRVQWDKLNLARANPWLNEIRFGGSSSGNGRFDFSAAKRIKLTGIAALSGTVTAKGRAIAVRNSGLNLDAGEHGLRLGMEIHLADGALLKGRLISDQPAALKLPDQGKFELELKGVDPGLFPQWLPPDVKLEGSLSGRATGKILPGQRFEMDGEAALGNGKVSRKRGEGELNLNLRTATASWSWRQETLRGALALVPAEYGKVSGVFQLPVSARFPVNVNKKAPFTVSLFGQLHEKGILTALFPGLIHESHGELDFDLKASGALEEPKMEGTLRLAGAGAYLPAAGIHVKDVKLAARLEKGLIRIGSFSAASGQGHIEGTALLYLKGGQLANYRGNITGERFQTIYFPELQILSSPKLTFEGTPEKLAVRGEVRLPELRITGSQSHAVIAPSKDVIVEGRASPVAKSAALKLDIQVRLILGERVLVKASGIDAQLGGSVELKLQDFDNVAGKGEIKVVKGRYKTYGVNLEIVRGNLLYAGGPIGQPTLDILALRTVGDVKAGVTVGGTLQTPIAKLYSDPAMPDVDILSYIVLGHPLGSSGEQAGLLAKAAGVLLSTGQSVVLQDQIKNRLGLSTLEIQSGGSQPPGLMGYKPVQSAPPGSAQPAQPAGISETMLTVGKYLTPKLYISYGRSLFSGQNIFLLRYDIFKNLQVESQSGNESGADLYYKIEFN